MLILYIGLITYNTSFSLPFLFLQSPLSSSIMWCWMLSRNVINKWKRLRLHLSSQNHLSEGRGPDIKATGGRCTVMFFTKVKVNGGTASSQWIIMYTQGHKRQNLLLLSYGGLGQQKSLGCGIQQSDLVTWKPDSLRFIQNLTPKTSLQFRGMSSLG